jgi:hypothetical protein
LATKITAVPLAGLLFLCQTWRARMVALGAALITVLALTLPISIHYGRMFRWASRLLVHKGDYGSGDVGLPSWPDIGERLGQIFQESPEIIITLLVCIVMLFRWTKDQRRHSLLAICTVTLSLQLVAVIKHWGPGYDGHLRYILPATAVVALAIGAISDQLQGRQHGKIAICLLASVLTVGIWHNARAVQEWLQDSHGAQRDSVALINQISNSGCTVVPYYGANTQEYKLMFGNLYSSGAFASLLASQYPRFLSYNVFLDRFEAYDHVLDHAEAQRWLASEKCVYLVGWPIESFDTFGISPNALALVARTQHKFDNSLAIYNYQFRP